MTEIELKSSAALFVDGYAILDPKTYLQYSGLIEDSPWGRNGFNGEASNLMGTVRLSEAIAEEESPPCWSDVGLYGEYGCVLTISTGGFTDSAVDVSIFPYEYGGLDAFLFELKHKSGIRLFDGSGAVDETFEMGLHPLTAIDRDHLFAILDGEEERGPTQDTEESGGDEEVDGELLIQVVDTLRWGRGHAKRLSESIAKPRQSIDRLHGDGMAFANASPFDTPTLGELVEWEMTNDVNVAQVTGTRDHREVNLAGRKLGYLDFEKCDLRGATLSDCDLRGNRFAGADIRGAVLDRCTFGDEPFGGALIAGASFRGANFEETWSFDPNWEGCDSTPPDFEGALLGDIDFSNPEG